MAYVISKATGCVVYVQSVGNGSIAFGDIHPSAFSCHCSDYRVVKMLHTQHEMYGFRLDAVSKYHVRFSQDGVRVPLALHALDWLYKDHAGIHPDIFNLTLKYELIVTGKTCSVSGTLRAVCKSHNGIISV